MELFRYVGFYFWIVFVISLLMVPAQSVFARDEYRFQQTVFRDNLDAFVQIDVADYPVLNTSEPIPDVSAESILLLDVDSKVPIFEKNAQAVMYPASTTKLMTALVALDGYSLQDTLVMPEVTVFPSIMGLKPQEKILARDLLYGLLIQSGNDAALTLAENYNGGYEGFVAAMNEKARELGLSATHYRNPSGLQEEGHVTTARDLGHLAAFAFAQDFINVASSTERKVVYGLEGERHVLNTTNKLLGELRGMKGAKTGFTDQAGEVLVSYVERDGRTIVCVVLKSKDRFGETELLVDWLFRNTSWEEVSL